MDQRSDQGRDPAHGPGRDSDFGQNRDRDRPESQAEGTLGAPGAAGGDEPGVYVSGADEPGVQRDLVEQALRSPGRPIDPARRGALETFHQTDLSGVRLHTGAVARRSAAAIGARAYTVGADIVLGAGGEDAETIGHETRHVGQQSEGRVAGVDNGGGLRISDPGHTEEREAAADGVAFRQGMPYAPSAFARRAVTEHLAAAPPPGPGGSATVRRAVQRMRDDAEPPAKKARTKGKSQKDLVDDVTQVVIDSGAASYGGGRHGRATDEVRLRYARDKEEERSGQTLSHLSFLTYDAIRAAQDAAGGGESGRADVDDREVQGMLINDRLLFASNFNDSIDSLKKAGDEQRTLRDLLRAQQSEENRRAGLHDQDATEYVDRLKRAEAKINQVFDGERGVDGEDATAEAVRASLGRPVMYVDAADPRMKALLTEPQYAGSVMMLRFGATDKTAKTAKTAGAEEPGAKAKRAPNASATSHSMHAEQKLLVAIRSAGLRPEEVKGDFAIEGKYRGCLGCNAALRYYRDVAGFGNLEFNPNYGFYYEKSVKTLAQHLRHVVDDPQYLEYVKAMLDAPMSTAAPSWQAPPRDDPTFTDDNGPQTLTSAANAQGRGYTTASDTDAESRTASSDSDSDSGSDPDRMPGIEGASRTRRRKLVTGTRSGGRKLGPGKAGAATRPTRAARVADDADVARLVAVWGKGPAAREEQGRVFRDMAAGGPSGKKKMSAVEIVEITGASESIVRRLLKGTTGHEARDGRQADPERKRVPQRAGGGGKAKKTATTFTKGANVLPEKDRADIQEALRAAGNHAFYRDWQELHDTGNPTGRTLSPGDMDDRLARTLDGIRERVAIPQLARELFLTADALRKFLNRKFGTLNAGGKPAVRPPAAPPPSTPGGDVEMGDPEPAAASSSAAAPREPAGYDHRVDAQGQHTYVRTSTGDVYYFGDDGRLALLPPDRSPGPQEESSASEDDAASERESGPEYSDAGDTDSDVPYEGKGKGKAPARRR
ncbi:eCIS core domain-containing protein [Actinacidiphila sp. ITFR-21]|uniref:eCIS core domain-containing protein n=1 Tax=Actinacidiphila sp. ITFR-21 TaxID=3075199 RepID=UPI00288AFC32|nr:DUF4157 domain-containing protein [Streptomyces sp. ITFR-21]WNI17250.1 DUF4157 domain-containing protein [Streptomyces sp. ITFR-21]